MEKSYDVCFEIYLPTNDYINWFWYQLKQKPDLRNVLIDWFPNPKEQTENMPSLEDKLHELGHCLP